MYCEAVTFNQRNECCFTVMHTVLLIASEAVTALHQRGVTQQTGATLELVASDVLDHYRTYSLLERLLHNPPKLAEQLAFQIEPQTRRLLIEK
jgi:hypothetical protein